MDILFTPTLSGASPAGTFEGATFLKQNNRMLSKVPWLSTNCAPPSVLRSVTSLNHWCSYSATHFKISCATALSLVSIKHFQKLNKRQLWQARRSITVAALSESDSALDSSTQEDTEAQETGGDIPFGFSVTECPQRLEYVPKQLVDDHTQIFYAMINDTDRNDFYWHALKACNLEGKFVVDIGSGSGILSMMAAKLGARRVVGVEECGDLVRLAQQNVAANGLEHCVEIRHGLAADLELDELADVLVTETLGTWMTCEGIVQYCEDARRRFLKDDAQFVPQYGEQYAVLIESDELEKLFTCRSKYRGLDLSAVMELQDTASSFWSKQVGVKPSDLVYREVSAPFKLLHADFSGTRFADLPTECTKEVPVQAGRIHAILNFWIVEDAQGRQLSTDPRARRCEPWAYARDIAWGNSFQLVGEELDDDNAAQPDDPRWTCFENAAIETKGPVYDGADIRLCKCMCVYHGAAGFLVVDGRAQMCGGSTNDLLDPTRRIEHPGCKLYVRNAADGSPQGLKAPQPFDVQDDEIVFVRTAFHPEHRGAQHFIRRSSMAPDSIAGLSASHTDST